MVRLDMFGAPVAAHSLRTRVALFWLARPPTAHACRAHVV